MQRRFALTVFAAVGLAALTASRVGLAQETAAPGTITTVAGTGPAGFSGDGGPATQARLANPWGVVVDAAGNVFVADHDNYRVRKVSPSGMISTVAGTGKVGFSGDGGMATQARLSFPTLMTWDLAGDLFIADGISDGISDGYSHRVGRSVRRVSSPPSRGPAGSASPGTRVPPSPRR
jgi:hypothetical protein